MSWADTSFLWKIVNYYHSVFCYRCSTIPLFLVRDGDRICIFGFSRGAYTARALAGMIEKVGLLPSGNHQQVPFAYRMYMQDDEEGKYSYQNMNV